MSWLDAIVGFGKKLFTSNLGGAILKTVVTGYLLRKVTKSIQNANKIEIPSPTPVSTPSPAPISVGSGSGASGGGSAPAIQQTPDYGVRLQLTADPNTKIPVVYGQAVLGGKLIDAQMSGNNQYMTYALAICERTGALLSSGLPSTFTFEEIYMDGQRFVFNSDGITVNYTVDSNGSVDRSLSGLVKVFCYAGSSTTPVVPSGYTNPTLSPAWSSMPGWTSANAMNDLIFAIIQVKYDRDKNSSGLGDVMFKIKNTMTLPGDCMYDYMTNTRYGAGIPAAEIEV